jgi:hypothetical protein
MGSAGAVALAIRHRFDVISGFPLSFVPTVARRRAGVIFTPLLEREL